MILRTGLILVCLTSLAYAEGPVIVGLTANAQVPKGHSLVVKLRPVAGAKGYSCKLRQDDFDMDGDAKGGAHPTCTFPELDPDGGAKPGPAELRISAFLHDDWTQPTTLPIVIKAGIPKGGAGTKWDGAYWHGGGRTYGALVCSNTTIKNGVMTIPIAVGGTSFGNVKAIVEPDGSIIAQTFKLPKARITASPGAEADEADATTEVTVSAIHAKTFNEKYFTLRVEGAQASDSRPYFCEERLYGKGDGWDVSHMPDCPSLDHCGLFADCCPDNPHKQ